MHRLHALSVILLTVLISTRAHSQQGYEFEIYNTDIGRKGSIEIELNSNYVASGVKNSDEGLFPTHHATRTSLELGYTINDWARLTGYVNANSRPDHSLSYMGNRVKLTTIAPSSWNLPFDLGVANEVSYAKPGFAEYQWTYELSPIVARRIGPVSLVFNPALERGLSGSGEHHIELEPRGKIAYGFGDEGAIALEYYAGLGGIGENYAVAQQRHQIFARGEAEFADRYEFNAGIGRGLTRSSDRWVIVGGVEIHL